MEVHGLLSSAEVGDEGPTLVPQVTVADAAARAYTTQSMFLSARALQVNRNTTLGKL